MQHNKMLSPSISGALGSLRERSQLFFSLLPAGDGRFAFDTRREFLEENGDEFIGLNQALTRLAGELEGLQQKPEEVFNFVRRAQEIQVQLGLPWNPKIATRVFWIERRGGRGFREKQRASRASVREDRSYFTAAKMYSCKPRRSTSAPSCGNACGRSWTAPS